MLLIRVREIMDKLESVVDITVPEDKEITVCGDTHG